MKYCFLNLIILLFRVICFSQQPTDQSKSVYLEKVIVTGIRTVRGTGHMPDSRDGIIYAGKKNEAIVIDSLDANKSINNTRQILGRIPGLNIVESESSGFTANGIATRGLNPVQSIEMNTRQNGYNISADIYGYNEAYYIPPMEAVSRIEMVRGAASLQFGSQFGGMVNYVLKEAPKNKPFEFTTSQTAGSYGLFNSFNAVGGTVKKWSYYGFLQNRTLDGWRPNSRQWQLSGFGRLQYNDSDKLNIGFEYTILRNRIKMPGGLTDSMFNADPRASFRSRNWLKSPWNIATAYLNYKISLQTSLSIKTSYLFSNRALVWRNEDGGAGAMDEKDPATGEFVNREVENERMQNTTTEIRLLHNYSIGRSYHSLATGIRIASAVLKRMGGGKGTTGSGFDLAVEGDYQYNLDFTTTNIAPFIENIFRMNNHLTIIPGFRFEYLQTTSTGYKEIDNVKLISNESRKRDIPLFGLGAEYKVGTNTNVYANISQAYRPINYSQLTPFGATSKIDPHLKDAYGYNADLGYRGTIKSYLNFDIGLFYLAYNKRIGRILMNAGQADEYTLRTNVANSIHKGIESYIEFNVSNYFNADTKKGLSLFHSFAFTDARYSSGEFKGKRVETAVKYINRIGVTYYNERISGTFQVSNVGDAYGDATNARVSDDPVAGYIPAYTVLDLSGTYRLGNYSIKAGVNNLANQKYFTQRTDEYPGPGIIPSIGRMIYAGVSARL